jgi:Heavy metal binding domain
MNKSAAVRSAVLTACVLLAAVAIPAQPPAPDQNVIYMCPMHPDVRGKAGDHCGRCGMELVAAAVDYSPFVLDVDVTPRALRPKEQARVRFFVRNPKSGAVVRRFETVHERVFHLFIVGRDLTYFAHVHPTLHPDGVLDVPITVPRPGVYQLIADFVPAGAAPQLLQRSIVTADYTGPLNAAPTLAEDLRDKVDHGLRAELTPPDPRAGREQLITLQLSDDATGAPFTDLEPYLGTTGHLLVASVDMSVVFHSHPVAEVSSRNGPSVVFQVLFPRPGTYRMWAQFQRHGRVATVPFTVSIRTPA